MFLVVINTILESVSEIFYKKALLISNLRPTVFQFIFEMLGLVFVTGMILFVGFDWSRFSEVWIVIGFVVLALSYISYNNIAQKLYREEKMSVLMPYFKINNFLVIIAGFFFFHDASFISFLICLVALGVVVWGSYDPEQKELPKNFWLVMAHETLRAVEMLVIAAVLRHITSVEYMVLYQLFYVFFAFFLVLIRGEFVDVKKLNLMTIGFRGVSYVMWFAQYFIDTFLVKEYGVIIATLFGFFGSSISLGLAYIMFREVPTKKDVILAVVLLGLVGLGYYFK